MAVTQLTSIPIVTIIVCVVMGLNVLSGAIRGFVRKISGIVAFFLAIILVTALLPVVTAWLHKTPVYDFIRNQCETIGANLVQNTIAGALGGTDGSGTVPAGVDTSTVINAITADDGSGSIDRGKIKEQLQALGYDPSLIDSMSDAELESYTQQLIGAFAGMIPPVMLEIGMPHLPDGETPAFSYIMPLLSESAVSVSGTDPAQTGSAMLSQLTAGMDRVDQMKFIESLPLPQSIKDQMETFNNENGYLKLGASDFGSYIINYIASLIMNMLAYIVTLLAVWIIIRLVLGALSIFRALPIFGAADHLLGLLLGIVQGILIVWGLFLVLSLFSTTQVGEALMREINASPVLSLLYNANPFLNSAAGAIRGIM